LKDRIMICPSLLSANFSKLAEEIKIVEDNGADGIHLDVMDGHFVPNITIGPVVVESIRKVTRLPFWSHLMITEPDKFIKPFRDAGTDGIYVHQESQVSFLSLLQSIRELGVQSGAVINPETEFSTIKPYLRYLNRILVMTVHPGFGGQQFIFEQLDKIRHIRRAINQSDYEVYIEVDGGINLETVTSVVEAGADILAIGSAIYRDQNPGSILREIRKVADKAFQTR
jgi:ribulose-phosphate 3-epimerase